MKKIYPAILCLLTIAVTPLPVRAKDFNTALNELVADCPQLEILKKNNEATILTERALNRLAAPEISVDQVWGRNGVGNKFDLGISQSFDWPSLYRARNQAITAQTTANSLLEQTTLLEKVGEVKALMVDIIFQKKSIDLSRMIHSHMLQMEEGAAENLRKGEISKLDYKRTQLERIQTAIQLRENERLLNELYRQLNEATGKSDADVIMADVEEIPAAVIHTEEDYERKLATLDPRMAYLNATIRAVDATSRSERMAATLPAFSVGYIFQREQGETFNGFNISLTLPVYGSSHVRNAAKANIVSAQLEAQMEQIAILSQMRSRRRAALALAQELTDYSTIFENGNYSELLKMALEGGQTDNLHYLQELNYYIGVTKEYLELQHQYNLALISLNRYDIFED